MAVSLDAYAPFDSGAGANVTEDEWRQFMRLTAGGARQGTTGNGIVRFSDNEMIVYADSSGDQVKVKTGEVWINGMWGRTFSEKTLPIAVGHATLARIDTVVCRAHQGNNVFELDVLEGTPNAVPVAPTPTVSSIVNEIQLAQVNVPALDNNIAAAQVFDGRRFMDIPEPLMTSSADTTVNNSTTYVDVTGMNMLVSMQSMNYVEGFLEYSAATAADIKWRFSGPSGTIGRITSLGLDTAAAGTTASGRFDTQAPTSDMLAGGAGAGTRVGVHIKGWLQTAAVQTSGDPLTNPMKIKIQFAQNTANASDAVVYSNSWVKLTHGYF